MQPGQSTGGRTGRPAAGCGGGETRRRRTDRAPAPRRAPREKRLQGAEDDVLVELAVGGDGLLADHRQAEGADLLLDERVELLDHGDPRDLLVQPRDLAVGQRVRHAQLEEPRLGKGLARVRVGDARGDDAEVGGAGLEHVERRLLGARAQPLQALEHEPVPQARVLRHHHVLADVARVVARLELDRHARDDPPAAVRDPRRGAQQHRRVELLRQREGLGDEVVGLLAVGRLEHRDLGELGVVAVVLLVLRGVHAGVVGADDDQAGVDAGERERHEGVGGHVETHVLHGHDGAHAGERSAHGGLEGDLLVDAPLGVDAFEARRPSRGSRSTACRGSRRRSRPQRARRRGRWLRCQRRRECVPRGTDYSRRGRPRQRRPQPEPLT